MILLQLMANNKIETPKLVNKCLKYFYYTVKCTRKNQFTGHKV